MSTPPGSDAGPLRFLEGELDALRAADLLRAPPAARGASPTRIDLGSNDYLGYALTGRLRSAAIEAAGRSWAGASASRLISGQHSEHDALERAVADWLRVPAALTFSSGWAANVGTLSALVRPDDLVVSDAWNHASLIDGCRLSRARVQVVAHLDVDAVRGALRAAPRVGRRWVVTESYFSMDGDVADLAALRDVCDEYDAALYVDEAHAVGAVGPEGRGLAAAAEVVPDVLVGTFGKAFGAQGAFVAGSAPLREYLWNRARSFVFSTGASPLSAAIAQAALSMVRADDASRARLATVAARLRAALPGVASVGRSVGAIIPVVVGEPAAALGLSNALGVRGIDVRAIRPPTVPVGTSRLRIAASAGYDDAALERIEQALREVVR